MLMLTRGQQQQHQSSQAFKQLLQAVKQYDLAPASTSRTFPIVDPQIDVHVCLVRYITASCATPLLVLYPNIDCCACSYCGLPFELSNFQGALGLTW